MPVTRKELLERGVAQPDFVLVSPDAYVDHPSFAGALVGRHLESFGYTVAMLAQPDWRSPGDFRRFGRPRLAFLVSGGNMDSMVNLYTANKRRRREDLYSPGGHGRRPERATAVYAKLAKEAYPDVPVIIGGIEASLRRFAHYDYWDDTVRPSILADCPADLLIYGMGEHPLRELAEALESGLAIEHITYIRGTCYFAASEADVYEEKVVLPSLEAVARDKRAFARAFRLQYENQDPVTGKTLLQQHGARILVQNPPALPLTEMEMDDVYSLPFVREQHPSYKEQIPALREVQFSLVSSRGCFGGCAFCAICFHQGRHIQSRSVESLAAEAEKLVAMPGFKGYIHDVGGPTANFTVPPCAKAAEKGMCTNRRCLAPRPCPNLRVDHSKYLAMLRRLRQVKGVKKVFVRSGVRFDYAVRDAEFIGELAAHHTSGMLKVAPEHCAKTVLDVMGKPSIDVYETFCRKYRAAARQAGREQYVLPYFIASHPGCTLGAAIELAVYLKRTGFVPDQVQDFYPTPGSVSTCIYYTGLDPFTMRPVYVPKSAEERAMQRALLQFNKPENYELVKKALLRANRTDLIGNGPDALIRG